MIRRRALLASTLLPAAPAARSAQAFVNAAVVLLQPDDVILARIKSAKELARYIKDIETAAGASIEGAFQRKPLGGFVVVALKPGGRSKVWLDLDAPLPDATQLALRSGIEAVAAPEVQSGVVVFALKASFWGGRLPQRVAPAPAEWRAEAARAGAKLEVGALVDRVWHD